ISEFLDPLGHTYAETGLEQEATVADRLRTSDVIPLYVRLGDWVGALCVLATLGFAGVLLADKWRSGRSTCDCGLRISDCGFAAEGLLAVHSAIRNRLSAMGRRAGAGRRGCR